MATRNLPSGAARQRGIALVFTLIAVLILMIASIAMVRSFTTATLVAGSLAFKRDVTNQSERGFGKVNTIFSAGGVLANSNLRTAPNTGANYTPCVLPSDSRGVPIIIQDDANFTGTADLNTASTDANCTTAFTSVGNDIVDATTNVTIRYVVDRMCVNSQAPTGLACITSSTQSTTGPGGHSTAPVIEAPTIPVYRVTVRVITGNVRAYLQSSMTTS